MRIESTKKNMLKINIAQQLIMGILEHKLLWIYPGKCVARKYLLLICFFMV